MSPASDRLAREIRQAAVRSAADPQRLRLLFAGGVRDAAALATFLRSVVPLARASIRCFEQRARAIADDGLRQCALRSFDAKAFHIAGACVLASFMTAERRRRYIDAVAPLETIYDYLDSVGDEDPLFDANASRALHTALSEAFSPAAPGEYFTGDRSDGGYLRALVDEARSQLDGALRSAGCRSALSGASALYAETQTLKHLPAAERSIALQEAFAERAAAAGLTWFEYAAACGSQLHVYGALFTAYRGHPDDAGRVYAAYFPEAAAVHVLLDAFIDQAEDRARGELNWLDCYENFRAFASRLQSLARRAAAKLACLPESAAHDFSFRLLVVFYLTHPKVWQQRIQRHARALVRLLASGTT